MKNKKLTLSQIGLYNPQRLSDEVIENLFVVRTKFFQFLMEKLNKEEPNSIPQHHLVIAQRGMGKTMLLKRIEVELRKKEYQNKFIPLLFPEEQYNMKNLAEFWLNTLDALADTLEYEKKMKEVKQIDTMVKELEGVNNNEYLAKEAFQFLKAFTQSINRRPVLLIDNMSLIFDRLGSEEQHTLRAWLMQNGAPVVIGASAVAIEDTFDYGAPFYDALQIHYLNKLSFEELIEILTNLARLTQEEEILPSIQKQIARLKTLYQLTGGNPRTATMLFKLIIRGFSKEINDDLEALLDEITPLYKARFEELPAQMQVIVDAIALFWDPINLEQLREETRYENNQLSPQLKRLVESGWIERTDAYQAKGNAYLISERFFNIWFLMRRSSRRQKKELYCLSKFLESFYGDELGVIAQNRLRSKPSNLDYITYSQALAEAIKDKKLKKQLQSKSYIELGEFAITNPDILDQFDLPSEVKDKIIGEILTQYLLEKANQNYFKAEKLILKLAELTENNQNLNFKVFNEIGNLCIEHLQKYDTAEKAYKRAIDLDKNSAYPWNGLGNLYQDQFQKYDEAEKAYLKAIDLGEKSVYPKFNLVFLYRDKMNRLKDAEALFNSMEINTEIEDSFWLNKALFELYKRNEGIAINYFEKALARIKDKLPQNTQDDWWRFGAIVNKLGYGKWLLAILEETGYNIVLSPYFVAIKAMNEKDTDGYLNSKAVEIREPAVKLMELMKKY